VVRHEVGLAVALRKIGEVGIFVLVPALTGAGDIQRRATRATPILEDGPGSLPLSSSLCHCEFPQAFTTYTATAQNPVPHHRSCLNEKWDRGTS
jgi:hypothetical protein